MHCVGYELHDAARAAAARLDLDEMLRLVAYDHSAVTVALYILMVRSWIMYITRNDSVTDIPLEVWLEEQPSIDAALGQ